MQDYSPPPAEYTALPPEIAPPGPEFTPEGVPRPEAESPNRRRKLRFLLYAAAALVYLGLLFKPGESRPAPTPPPAPPAVTAEPAPPPEATPELTPEPTAAPTPTPEPMPEPVGKEPGIRMVFFAFSHEHHARVYLSNTDAVHSVEVQVRDKVLDLVAYDNFLSEEEIASGFFELPVVSTGTLFEEHSEEYYAAGTPMPGTDYVSPAWPEFELAVTAWYESEDGSGEDTLTMTAEPEFELGVGMSYWMYDWDEQIPQYSFRIIPWEEIAELSFVIDDPDAVTNPMVISVDISYNGRHAAPEEYETVLYKEEYSVLDRDSGEYVPTVGYTKQLILRRPDWMPEQGTVHVVLVQQLATTGERWVREFDYDYGVG